MSVVIETTIGDVTVDLYLKERPNTCLNFLKLCKIKYYNLCVFYKIEKNFIAQTGDPTATGRGGESLFCCLYGEQAKYFDAEFKPRLKHEKLGTLSMVNNGNNMNGSQFFFTLNENLTYLDENHTVFGEVTEGFETLQKLNDAICDNSNRPYQDIRITHTVVLHDPFDDPKGLEIPDASPEPTKEMLESNYIGADEEIDDTEGKTAEEIEEKIKISEAKARATILEMVGDIPDADVKPPENVLFVCKLNPVTTSEDLEIIFSRFGKILSCEVIKDRKTGDSLQYAFIEFEREEDCEAAYFKMDNVLIDDRRIHVDFSQSVSKMNFDQDKMLNTKQKSNFSLKRAEREDGYSLIFDMDDNVPPRDKERKSRSNEYHTEKKKPKRDREEKNYERKYKDSYHSYEDKDRYSDPYTKSRSRHFEQSVSRRYKDSGDYKKSPERSPRRYRTPERKRRYDSVSPDKQRKSSTKYREQSHSDVSRQKHSDKYDRREHSKSTSYKKSEKDRIDLSSLKKSKAEISRKAHSPEKHKKSKRKSPITSSSSSSDSYSSSSSSSSSSDGKRTKKSRYHKQKELSVSRKESKSHKKRKYS